MRQKPTHNKDLELPRLAQCNVKCVIRGLWNRKPTVSMIAVLCTALRVTPLAFSSHDVLQVLHGAGQAIDARHEG